MAKRLTKFEQRIMERSRAARAYIESVRSEAAAEELMLRGFMATIHPEYSDEAVDELVRDQRAEKARRRSPSPALSQGGDA